MTRSTLTALGPVFLLAAALAPAQDFGDAPDGTPLGYGGAGATGGFPTSAPTSNSRVPGNVGINHALITSLWLGPAAAPPTGEVVPNMTDLDVDNSGAYFVIPLISAPAPAILQVPVTVASSAPPGPYFLNVLVDRNNDGEWSNLPGLKEWVVVDRPVSQAAGTTQLHGMAMPWATSLFLLPKWVRISLTTVPLATASPWGSAGWDGSMPPGAPFTIGETEDRFVGAVYPGTAGPGGGPPPDPSGGGNPGGIGGGAFGKGVLFPGANPAGACLPDIDCEPEDLVVPCGKSKTLKCTVTYKSGDCPELAAFPGCNVAVDARFLRHLAGVGPLAKVSPNPQCGWVGPGARKLTFLFTVSFPPPCNPPNANPRRQRWQFVCIHDPDGVYGEIGADEREGTVITLAPPDCGNGIPQPPFESCDDGNLLYGDSCTGDCKVPTFFPDGFVGPGEQCDDGNSVSGDGCSMFGLREYCGNLVVNPHEECDDGNGEDLDGCNRHCQIETTATCPNGSVDHAMEQCDDGNLVDGDGCDANCQLELCGDGSIDLGEECDDGNGANGDGCSTACTSEGACGNGWIDAGEQCDDGNTLEGDGCSAACQRVPIHVEGLALDGTGKLRWDPVVLPVRSYDVLRGDLDTLLAAGGDHGVAGASCLAQAVRVETTDDFSTPASGGAFYYLVRVSLPWGGTLATYDPAPPATGYAGGRDAATGCD